MSVLDSIIAELENVVGASKSVQNILRIQTGWLDYGLPLQQGPYPCLRMDGLTSLNDKVNRHYLNIKLWSMTMDASFFNEVEQVQAALAVSERIQFDGFIHQPEENRNCAVFPVVFIP